MIKRITKIEFLRFVSSLSDLPLLAPEKAVINTLKEFVEEREDEEIEIIGYLGESEKLAAILHFLTESIEYILEHHTCERDCQITLISALFVHPDHRGKGIARNLVEHVMNEAETEIVVADPFDEKTTSFFISNGFSNDNDFGDTDKWLLYREKNKVEVLV